ncbi:MAG: flavin reductase [Deltaproteobacteria bacterium]|nr:flavin reductase [Deltaproteobacteria bacterium]
MSLLSFCSHEIFLVTASHEGRDSGFIATWIMPATLVPDRPRIVGVFSPQNFTFNLLQQSKKFIVHLLAEDQVDLLPHFGLTSSRNLNKFEGMDVQRSAHGIPIISGTCGYMECQLVDQLDSGDRIICLADVTKEDVDATKKPLRKETAFETLSPEIVQKLIEKRIVDGQRDRQFIKRF